MALIDVDYFNTNLTQLGLKSSFSPKAENLEQLILDASEWVEDYTRRIFEVTEVIEVVHGNGHRKLMLEHWPITEVDTIEWEDSGSGGGFVDEDDYRILAEGVLEWKGAYTWRTDRVYTITYSAGYDPIPNVVKRATALKVVDLFSPQYQGPSDDRNVEFVSKIEVMIADLLEKYRRDRIA